MATEPQTHWSLLPFTDFAGNLPFTLLSVSPSDDDHAVLGQNLTRRAEYPGPRWSLAASATLDAGMKAAVNELVGVVICERDLFPGTWRDMLDYLHTLPHSPLLIVTSPLADESLWAEALNLGAYDVLAKPFDPHELQRVLNSALVRWQERSKRRSAAAC